METKHIVQTLKNVIKLLDNYRPLDAMRAAGFIEGLLISEDALDRTFVYLDIEVENPSVFTFLPWVKQTIIRKENYQEYMKRMATKYIKENT